MCEPGEEYQHMQKISTGDPPVSSINSEHINIYIYTMCVCVYVCAYIYVCMFRID